MSPSSKYRKGYRAEREAMEFMGERYGCVCVRTAGSHGVADLICGNGIYVYVVQVKSGKTKPYVDWQKLRHFASFFRAIPLLLWKKDYEGWKVLMEEDYR
jgi:Holliday junction resolvase